MTANDLFTQSRQGLLSHRLRATLSSLGIVVGVATVVASLAISEGAKRAAIADLGTLGIDNLFARATVAADDREKGRAPELTRRDADAIGRAVSGIEAVAVTRLTRAEVAYRSRAAVTAVAGVSTAWTRVAGLAVDHGRWLSSQDEQEARRVVVIGAALARRMLVDRDPLGTVVSIGGQAFRVVGVLGSTDRRSGSALQIFNADEAALVPWNVMDLPLGQGDDTQRVSEIGMRLTNGSRATEVAAAVSAVLARRHATAVRGYELVVPRELLRARLRAQRTFDAVLLATGLVALIISGIGIMNIMLASVTERQHEIGVRRAVGARRGQIMAQFALEAALLCLTGGLLGVPLGGAFAWIVALLAAWPVALTWPSLALALVMAATAGLTFGIYPAYRAASVDPVEALRA